MKSGKPSARQAIVILAALQQKVGPALLAYWVTPNTILTLCGARAFCDGVFYSDNGKQALESWSKQVAASLEALDSITDIYFSETKLDLTAVKQEYMNYNVIMGAGFKYALEQTRLIGPQKQALLKQNLPIVQLAEAMCGLLKNEAQFTGTSHEDLNHTAFGILLGYPDKAIMGAVAAWETEDDPFAEPLISADVRGASYYDCPQPVYSYPRHLVNDPDINAHEQLWSTLLKDYYSSDFHKELEKNQEFQNKLTGLGLNR